jgi:hypothetical protein
MQLIRIAGNGLNGNGPVRGLLYRQANLPAPAARRSKSSLSHSTLLVTGRAECKCSPSAVLCTVLAISNLAKWPVRSGSTGNRRPEAADRVAATGLMNHIEAERTLRCEYRDAEHEIDTKQSHIDIGHMAMQKAMWRIVPLILLAYLLASMERVNISFASLQMNDELKFSATVYGLGAGLFFLAYALFEVPSSLMLRRYSPPQWIARIMITWGLLAAGMMFVRTPMQFYVVRFLLGAAEAGFLPSVLYYFSSWFPMAWRGRAVSRMYIAGPLGSIVMGSISAELLGLDGSGGLQGWQWLFLAQGLPHLSLETGRHTYSNMRITTDGYA